MVGGFFAGPLTALVFATGAHALIVNQIDPLVLGAFGILSLVILVLWEAGADLADRERRPWRRFWEDLLGG